MTKSTKPTTEKTTIEYILILSTYNKVTIRQMNIETTNKQFSGDTIYNPTASSHI